MRWLVATYSLKPCHSPTSKITSGLQENLLELSWRSAWTLFPLDSAGTAPTAYRVPPALQSRWTIWMTKICLTAQPIVDAAASTGLTAHGFKRGALIAEIVSTVADLINISPETIDPAMPLMDCGIVSIYCRAVLWESSRKSSMLRCPPTDFFDHPTIHKLAEYLEDLIMGRTIRPPQPVIQLEGPAAPALRSRSAGDELSLSPRNRKLRITCGDMVHGGQCTGRFKRFLEIEHSHAVRMFHDLLSFNLPVYECPRSIAGTLTLR